MEKIVWLTLVFRLLLFNFFASRGVRTDELFENFECYKDLCVDRLMFCHQREQRCKLCTREYCLPSARTPEQCKPHCPELLRTTTTTPTTTTTEKPATLSHTTTGIPALSATVSKQEIDNSTKFWLTVVLFPTVATVVVLLVVLVILVAVNLHRTSSVQKELRYRRLHKERDAALEEGRSLLGSDWSSCSSKDKAGGSSSASSGSSPPAKQDPALHILNPSVPSESASGPGYTARPENSSQTPRIGAFPDSGSTSNLHHHKGFEYRMTPTHDGRTPPPPYLYTQLPHQPHSEGVCSPRHLDGASPYTEDTCPKSV